MCYFKQGTISRMLFRGMLFALLAVCYPEYSRAVIAEDYQATVSYTHLRAHETELRLVGSEMCRRDRHYRANPENDRLSFLISGR